MNDFLHYILKVSLIFSVLYLFYRLCISRLTFHNVNRAFMLLMLPLSLIIPFIDIGLNSNFIIQNTSIPMLFDDFGDVENNIQQTVLTNYQEWSLSMVIAIFYAIGVFILLMKLLLNIIKLVKIKHQSESHVVGKYRVLFADVPLAFSCFRSVFLPLNKKQEINSSILEHEKLHGKAWHTLDLVLTELYVALFWFNPFVYLFRKDLKTVHEYQVDSMILQFDIKKSDYLQLMLNNLVSSHELVSLCNYFNALTIKKRVKMITKENSPKWKLISYLLAIPIISLMIMSFSGSANLDGDIPSISPIKVGEYDRISSTYGMRMHPVEKVSKFHSGIDFAAKKGTKIVATANGLVTSVEFKEGSYGKMLVINHGGGYETWYTQMSDYAVKQGDKVKRGDVIGFVGSSGASTGTHLHYEVRKNGNPVNPQEYIKN